MSSRRASRRAFLLNTAALASAGLLAACVPAISAPAGEGPTAAATAPEVAPSGPKKLVYWHGGGAPEHVEVTKQQIDLYTAKHPEVEIETVPGANNVKLIAALASGAPPDVAWPWGTPASGSWAANGLLTELDPLIEKTGFDKDNILPALLDCNMLDGKIWSLPWTVDVRMIAYNKRVLAEGGFENAPEAWEEMLQYSVQLTKTDDAGMITQLGFRPSVSWAMAFTFGAELMNAERTEVTPESEGFKDCLNWALEFYSKIPIEQITLAASGWGGWSTSEDPLVKGQLVMRQDGEYLLGYVERNAPEVLQEIGVAPFPYPGGKPQLEGTSETVAASLYIPKGVKDLDLSWSFVEHLMTDECTLLWCYLFPCLSQNKSSAGDEKLRSMGAGMMGWLIDYSQGPNIRTFPNSPVTSEYQDSLGEQIDLVIHGQKTVDEGLAAVKKAVQPRLDVFVARKQVQ